MQQSFIALLSAIQRINIQRIKNKIFFSRGEGAGYFSLH